MELYLRSLALPSLVPAMVLRRVESREKPLALVAALLPFDDVDALRRRFADEVAFASGGRLKASTTTRRTKSEKNGGTKQWQKSAMTGKKPNKIALQLCECGDKAAQA